MIMGLTFLAAIFFIALACARTHRGIHVNPPPDSLLRPPPPRGQGGHTHPHDPSWSASEGMFENDPLFEQAARNSAARRKQMNADPDTP